jgi:NADH-quinone oxidoreductase subunit B
MMFGFAIVVTAPAFLISRMISPRRRSNPVKFLPMECGQVPSGAGRTHFMMQYYAFILMFVVFDVMAIFLYAWGSTVLNLEKTATLPIMAFLGIMFAAMAYALYQAKRRDGTNLLKELITPQNTNAFVGKLGDILVKAIDKPLGYAINWGRLWSLWPVHIETACCSVEFGAASGPRYDVERFGIIEAFGSLRQCDLVVVQGTITRKMAPRLRLVYDQMPEPKYVIAMGACAITGGLYFDSYNVLPGIDGILPVDVYVPGCPPRPETLIQGCMLLQEKIKNLKVR